MRLEGAPGKELLLFWGTPRRDMSDGQAFFPQARFGQTLRRDHWWVQPLLTFLGLSAFIVYSTARAVHGKHFLVAGDDAQFLLSPFFSPLLFAHAPHNVHAWLGEFPGWMPQWVSPAFLILWAPAGFRFTCYYYRGAYYKAFWADPINCAVGEPRSSYLGEHSLPLIFQNIHRYFFYVAALFIGLLAHDAYLACWRTQGGVEHFGMSVGTLVLAINCLLLGGYTFGCHSARHLVGGGMDELSQAPGRHGCYNCVSSLNSRHMVWAWCSLFWVGFTDLYVWMCASGVWKDIRLF